MYANWVPTNIMEKNKKNKKNKKGKKKGEDCEDPMARTESLDLRNFNAKDWSNDRFEGLIMLHIGDIQLCYPSSCFESSEDTTEVIIIDWNGTIWYYFEGMYRHYCGENWSMMENGWSTVLNDALVIRSLIFGEIICEHPFYNMGCDPFHPKMEFVKSPMPIDLLQKIVPNIYGFCNRSRSFEYIISKFGLNIALEWNIPLKMNSSLTEVPIKNYEPFALICDSLFGLICDYIFTVKSGKKILATLRFVCSSFNNMVRPYMYKSFRLQMQHKGKLPEVPSYDGDNYICSLPEEIICLIFSFLPVNEITITRVSKPLRELALLATFRCDKGVCSVQLKTCTVNGIKKLHPSKCNCYIGEYSSRECFACGGIITGQCKPKNRYHNYDDNDDYDNRNFRDFRDEIEPSSKYYFMDDHDNYDEYYAQDDYNQDYDEYYDDD